MTPAMNRSPTEAVATDSPCGPVALMPVVAMEKITRLIDGGNRMPSAPDVVMTPAENFFG